GSWIYIGTQGIVQGTYETFAEVGRKHYGGNLKGRWFLTAGLGGMGGAQPLAATMAGASMIAIECQPSRIEMRLKTRYLDAKAASIDEALAINDYLPAGWTIAEWEEKRASDPKSVEATAKASMRVHVQAMLDLHKAGVP